MADTDRRGARFVSAHVLPRQCGLSSSARGCTRGMCSAHVHVCSSGHSLAPPGSSQAPRPAGARSGRGGRRGRRGRAARAAGARVLGAGHPPPRQPGSPRAARRSPRRRKGAVSYRSGGASRARARRRLPVAARAGTGASVADATFLIGTSSRRTIGAAEPLMLPTRQSLAPPLPGCSPPATALPHHHP